MRLLIIADVHGEFKKLDKIVDHVKEDFDVVVCPGDFTDMFNTPTNFSQIDVALLVLEKLMVFGKPLLCVPGNHDPYDVVSIFKEYGVNLHAKRREILGIVFGGFGGAATPFDTLYEPSEAEIREGLEKIGKVDVLVVHNPPKNTKMDRIESGQHVGSEAIRDYILKQKPKLVISAHIHEAAGSDKLGESLLFYPGPAFEGRYGIVDLDKMDVRINQVPLNEKQQNLSS